MSREGGLLAFYITIYLLCCAAVSARVYVRLFVVKSLGLDDYFMIVSFVFFTAIIGLLIWMTQLGLGQHVARVSFVKVEQILEISFVEEILYTVSIVTLKLSIMLLLLRLTPEGVSKLLVQWVGILYAIYGIVMILVLSLQCQPLAVYWKPTISGHCLNRNTAKVLLFITAVITLITDGIYATLPIILVWNIEMDRKSKISISIVLALGFSTVGVNIARFIYITAPNDNETDRTFNLFPIGLICVLEIALGIISASMVTLRPLLRRLSNTVSSTFSCTSMKSSFQNLSKKTATGIEDHSIDEVKPQATQFQDDAEEWCEILRVAHGRAATESMAIRMGF